MGASVVTEITELLTAIAIGVSSAAIISFVLIFIIVYKKKMQYYAALFRSKPAIRKVPDLMMVKPPSQKLTTSEIKVRTSGSLLLGQDLDEILLDAQWLHDVSGLIPHCLGILKNCRSLTERLATLSMGILNSHGAGLSQIVECARNISSRVDDMVSAMYPPLNSQLLEARASSLTLAVTHLAIIAQYECRNRKIPMDWIERALAEMESHMAILREASVSKEALVTSNCYESNSRMSTATSYA